MSEDLLISTTKHNWTVRASFIFEHRSNQKLQNPLKVGSEEIFSDLDKVSIEVSPLDDFCRILDVRRYRETNLIGTDLATGDIFDSVEVIFDIAFVFNDCTLQEAHEAFFRKIPSLTFSISNPHPEYIESHFLRVDTVAFHLENEIDAFMEIHGFEFDNQGIKLPRKFWMHQTGWELSSTGNLIWQTF